MMIKYRFSKDKDNEFSEVLRERVNAYFKEKGIRKTANSTMRIKSAVALSTYLLPYFIIVSGQVVNTGLLFGIWMVMGFGKAFVGMSVMHDSVHGSYSKKRKVSKALAFTARMLGMDPNVWNIQHNVLHHTYPNIEGADEDIAPRYVMRFSPNQPLMWFHRFQHIYVWLFYSLSTFQWVSVKDFNKLAYYRREGLVKKGREYNRILFRMIFWKALYFLFILGVPMFVLPQPAWLIFLMYFAMHVVAGLTLSFIFQPAHVISTSDFIESNEEVIDVNWSVHQLNTTSNFGIQKPILTYIAGGLNFQVEHHLFPHVCHVHYPAISKIVQQTAQEFKIPYHVRPSLSDAVINHYKTLKILGKGENSLAALNN